MRDYLELIKEIEIHVKFLEGFETSLNYWTRLFEKSGPRDMKGQNYQNLDMPRGSTNDSTLDNIVYNMNHFKDLIHTEVEYIEQLRLCEEYIIERIKDSDKLHNKVAYLKYQKDEFGRKKYTLQNIADMLVYSVDYIKEISKLV